MDMTVAMPFYRAKYIGWLPFESLIRQQNINFEWELLLIEEDNNESFGYERISEYISKLKELGCKQVFYKKLNEWVPLAYKIGMLIEYSKGDILTFAIADHYSAPMRLKSCYDAFKSNIDWYRDSNLIFYDIQTEELAVRRISSRGACCKAVQREIAEKIPIESDRWKGIDGWFYKQCFKVKSMKQYINTNWEHGLNTHGFGNLTPERSSKLNNHSHKFLKYNVKLEDVVPIEIANRLRQAKNNLSKHVYSPTNRKPK